MLRRASQVRPACAPRGGTARTARTTHMCRARMYSASSTPDLPTSPSWSVAETFGRQGEEKVAPEYLRHIARLSKLEVPAEKTDQLCHDLGKILAAVKQIQEVNTDGVAPLVSLLEETPLRLRNDVVAPDIPVEQVLRNAKDHEEGYFAVPKIREDFNT